MHPARLSAHNLLIDHIVHNLIVGYGFRMPSRENQPRMPVLDEQICFALYSASRAVTDVYRPLLGKFNLTYPQYLVLVVLWEQDDRSVKDIGTALQLDYGTVSPLLKRLEARGLATRHRQIDDERSVTVSLTKKGKQLESKMLDIPSAIGCAIGLSDNQRRDLITTLRALTSSVFAVRENSPRETSRP
jgi:DNA-binding MarR family transcriptional regulator